MKQLLIILLLLGLIGPLKAHTDVSSLDTLKFEKQLNTEDQVIVRIDSINGTAEVKFKRGKAIIFTVLTGLLGGHRIYLGTHHRTPIIYSITLGGLGILPFVDLINLIFTKDISKFEDKSQIIMWGK